MIRKGLLIATIVATAIVFVFVLSTKDSNAAKPAEYKLDRKYNQTDDQIKATLKSGWQLGGVYRECGEGFGEMEVTEDISAALLPLYEQLADQNKKEIFALLKKTNTPNKSSEILEKVISGQDRLTNYGDLPDYQALQERFEKINITIAELKSAKSESVSVQSLVERLEKFASSGTDMDVNPAMKAIQRLAIILQKSPGKVFDSSKNAEENMASLERVRKAIQESLKVAQKRGNGCRMVYLYYRAGP